MDCNTHDTDVFNLVISGVGGQGVLTLAEVLSRAALSENHNVRVGEIHGMAQRGGHVVCTVRMGPDAYGPIVDAGTAHLIVGFEPVETLREVELVRPDGYIIMNQHIQHPVAVSMGKADYPPIDEIISSLRKFANHIFDFNAMSLAESAGNPQSMNMVMFGAIIGSGLVSISKETALATVAASFPGRFEEINTRAFESGYAATSVLKW
ncbi:MAG: indolepyruvate oxidoreductase subunit beta [Candidatus Thorarchaeota archaeon]|nr:indolepyruvate oxidoreductase subunit beta [Candidatus Thorarchaeota archaeon]